MESDFFKKFKVITSLSILRPNFRFFFKEVFSENPVNLDMEVQVELSKLNFNFDDIRASYFLQVLRDRRHIIFVMLNGF